MDVCREEEKTENPYFYKLSVCQAGEKVGKPCDPRGERPFEPFLIAPSEVGHPSLELKCLAG